MKLREVFRYEVEYRLRSPATWIYAGFLFLWAIWMFLATADEPKSVYINSPERLAGMSTIVGMFGMLVSAAIFGDAAVRDTAVEMDGLIFTTPLRKAEYLGGRFLGALAVNAILVVAIPLGIMTANALAGSFETVGPFRVVPYLQAFVLFSLPNLFVVGAILYTTGALARHVVPVYLVAIGILIGSVASLNYPGLIGSPILKPLADPSGLGAVQELARYWPPAERNTRLIGFAAPLLWNRAVWLGIAAAVLGLLARVYRFAHAAEGGRRGGGTREPVATTEEQAGPLAVPRVAGSFGSRTTVRQTLAVARHSLAEVMASRWLVVVLVACLGLTLLWGWNVGQTLFDTDVWPVSSLVAETVLTQRVAALLYLLTALYAGELIWKERDVGVSEFADASPLPEGAALLGRFLALVVLLVIFQAFSLVGGSLIQALQGYYRFEPAVYAGVVGLNLWNYVLLAALAMTVHVAVNHKYLGHIVVVMAFILPRAAPGFGIRHNLLRYGMDPGWTYSDMNGFGPFLGPVVWFKLYWAAWAVLLLVAAAALWVRGRESGMQWRVRVARARLSAVRALGRATGTAIALILLLGAFIFYNTNVLNHYSARGTPRAEYEKRYARFADAPQPTIASADLRIEIHPETRAVDLGGTFHLVNRTTVAIDSVHVSLDPDLTARSFAFDHAATPALTDAETGYRIWALARTLKPGDSLALAFAVSWRPRGFGNFRRPTSVVANGSYFNRRLLPFIGYQQVLQLSDPDARTHFGLAPLPPMASPSDPGARQRRSVVTDGDFVQVRAVLGTSADQIAITPGMLRRSWTESGRSYFQYETEKPESFGAATMSGRYAQLEDRWKDVPLRIFYHPAHAFNLDRMVRSMKASLDYFTTEFGPYPDSQLRIVEVPRYDRGGSAHPNTIVFHEDNFLTRVDGDAFDMAFFGTAHEVAHTWWGGQVRGASGVRGEGLHESLANYSAMMVTETTYGHDAARRVYDFQMDRYLSRRAELGGDVPLLEIADQPWIAYGKGAVALYLLRDYIGAEAVNTALRRYLEKNRGGKPPFPTSLDLYAELRAVTPDSLRSLLSDLFEKVTLWDVRAQRARVEPAGGAYRVTIDVVAKKVRSDSVGKETEVPMDDLVEIGLFGPDAGAPLYLERHRIRSGTQTISIVVPRQPARAGVDPYHKLIDRQRDDNVVDVEEGR